MLNPTKAVRELKQAREPTQRELKQLDMTLKILRSLGASNGKFVGIQTRARKHRTLSEVARKRIAAAQRARWAKWKAAKRKKGTNSKPLAA